MPDFNEIVGMAGKLFSVVKGGVTEIIQEYKTKRSDLQEEADQASESATKPEAKPVTPEPQVKHEETKVEPELTKPVADEVVSKEPVVETEQKQEESESK